MGDYCERCQMWQPCEHLERRKMSEPDQYVFILEQADSEGRMSFCGTYSTRALALKEGRKLLRDKKPVRICSYFLNAVEKVNA